MNGSRVYICSLTTGCLLDLWNLMSVLSYAENPDSQGQRRWDTRLSLLTCLTPRGSLRTAVAVPIPPVLLTEAVKILFASDFPCPPIRYLVVYIAIATASCPLNPHSVLVQIHRHSVYTPSPDVTDSLDFSWGLFSSRLLGRMHGKNFTHFCTMVIVSLCPSHLKGKLTAYKILAHFFSPWIS